LGLAGVYLDLVLSDPVIKQAIDPSSGRFMPVPTDIRALEALSGLFAPDIEYLMRFALRGWMFVLRCPNEFSYAYAQGIRRGAFAPKPGGVYEKTNEYGLLGRFVSDYDVMCAWQSTPGGWKRVCSNWTGKTPLRPDDPGEHLTWQLNQHLTFKLQHGFNDCWVNAAGRPRNRKIGEEFVAFCPGHCEYFYSQIQLRSFYASHGMPWIYDG
jgi:hypothetical protein